MNNQQRSSNFVFIYHMWLHMSIKSYELKLKVMHNLILFGGLKSLFLTQNLKKSVIDCELFLNGKISHFPILRKICLTDF